MWTEIVQHGYYIKWEGEMLSYYIWNFHIIPWGTEKWHYRNSSFKYKHLSYTSRYDKWNRDESPVFRHHYTSEYKIRRVHLVLWPRNIVQEYVALNDQLYGKMNIILSLNASNEDLKKKTCLGFKVKKRNSLLFLFIRQYQCDQVSCDFLVHWSMSSKKYKACEYYWSNPHMQFAFDVYACI